MANAVNTEMGIELLDLWTDFVRNHEGLRCVILTGAGEDAFCGGGDMRSKGKGGRIIAGNASLEIFDRLKRRSTRGFRWMSGPLFATRSRLTTVLPVQRIELKGH